MTFALINIHLHLDIGYISSSEESPRVLLWPPLAIENYTLACYS